MKKTIFILALLFILPMAAQKNEATLYFRDGTVLEGFAKISQRAFSVKIKFRKKIGAKKIFYTSKELEYFKIKKRENNKISIRTYWYKKISGDSYTLLEQKEKGKVNLFVLFQVNHSSMPGPNGPIMTSSSISSYYVAKENEESLTHLGSKGSLFGKNFKKAASEYFRDCPELVKKIQDKEYRKKHIEKVVKYYNENCN